MLRTRTIALGLALCVGAAATATAQGAATSQDTTAVAHSGRRGPRGGEGQLLRSALFRGIQPTSDQRSQLEAIQGKYRPQMKSILDQMRPAMQEARSARQRGDTTAARTAFERTKGEREKLQALRKQELADVRSVLTPDQRQQFDKNLSDMQNRAGKRRGGKGAGVSGE